MAAEEEARQIIQKAKKRASYIVNDAEQSVSEMSREYSELRIDAVLREYRGLFNEAERPRK